MTPINEAMESLNPLLEIGLRCEKLTGVSK